MAARSQGLRRGGGYVVHQLVLSANGVPGTGVQKSTIPSLSLVLGEVMSKVGRGAETMFQKARDTRQVSKAFTISI